MSFKIKTCAVPCCKNNSSSRPVICFFNLPRDSYVRGEWLDVLGLQRSDPSSQIKVCEIHFRPKDFCANKKQLKTHAVPVLNLGIGRNDPTNSDDEFMQCESDSDPEIIELPIVKIKTEPEEKVQVKEEPDDTEYFTGRRPRRAAVMAAKKIHNTVRNYGISSESDPELLSPVINRFPTTPRQRPRQNPKSVQNVKHSTPVKIDLHMECHEEQLQTVQAEYLLKSQLEYNLVMRKLRSYKANNYNIIVMTSSENGVIDENEEECAKNGFNKAFVKQELHEDQEMVVTTTKGEGQMDNQVEEMDCEIDLQNFIMKTDD